MPYIFDIVAEPVARLLVVGKGVQGLATVGPLLAAFVAADQAEIAFGLGIGACRESRPQGEASARACALAAAGHIFVKGVERHAAGVGQHAIAHLGRWLGQGAGAQRRGQGQGEQGTVREIHTVHLSETAGGNTVIDGRGRCNIPSVAEKIAHKLCLVLAGACLRRLWLGGKTVLSSAHSGKRGAFHRLSLTF